MPSASEYSVERRGAKYYLYAPDGRKTGDSAFSYNQKEVAELYKMAAELNYKASKS